MVCQTIFLHFSYADYYLRDNEKIGKCKREKTRLDFLVWCSVIFDFSVAYQCYWKKNSIKMRFFFLFKASNVNGQNFICNRIGAAGKHLPSLTCSKKGRSAWERERALCYWVAKKDYKVLVHTCLVLIPAFYMCERVFITCEAIEKFWSVWQLVRVATETQRLSLNEFRGFWKMVAFTVNFLAFPPWYCNRWSKKTPNN